MTDEFPAETVERCRLELEKVSTFGNRALQRNLVIAVLRASGHAELVAALAAIKVGEVYGEPYIGVIAEDGCWSVKLDDAGAQRLFRAWMKQRDTALAAAGQGNGK